VAAVILILLAACRPDSTSPPIEDTGDTTPPGDSWEPVDSADTDTTDSADSADTAVPEEPPPPNLLLNPGFEDGKGALPDHWLTYGTGVYTWQIGEAVEGKRAMQLSEPDLALLYQRTAAAPGGRYRLTARLRSESGTASAAIKLEFHDKYEQKLDESVWELSAPQVWSAFTLTDTAPESTAFVTASLVGTDSEPTLFDDIAIQDFSLDDPPILAFDVADTQQTFDGMGTQIWGYASDLETLERGLTGLNIKTVRIENTQESATGSQMDATRALTDTLGVAWMPMVWSAPSSFGAYQLSDVDGFAQWWADQVVIWSAAGRKPETIELMNEPDSGGQWSTGITPEQYSDLVIATRIALDKAGFGDVGIVGPGATAFDYGHTSRDMVLAMSPEAVASLAVWSSHAWDDGAVCNGGASCVSTTWRDLSDAIATRDPDGERPIWVTEYATKQTDLPGGAWPLPDSDGTFNATWSPAYAVRLFENTLAHLNNGVSMPFLWQLMDEPTEVYDKDKAWGVLGLGGEEKPVWHALEPLCSALPVGGSVLTPPDMAGLPLVAGAVADETRIVIGLANDSDAPAQAILDIRGAVTLTTSTAFTLTETGDAATRTPGTATLSQPTLTLTDGQIPVTLPAWSTLTIELSR
jgi:hypothetical protein